MKIKINGTYIKFFDEVSYGLNLDSVASVFSFVGRFNPENPFHREIFRPLSYAKVEIFNNDDQLILTGTIVNHTKASKASNDLWKLSGYSLPGVLEDVNISYDQYPLESLQSSLKDITQRLIKPFNIGLVIDPAVSKDAGIIYEKSVASPSERIKDYLAKIASQRNIVLSHTANGELLYFRPDTKAAPKHRFTKENGIEMSLGVQGQGLHSSITVLRQPSDDTGNLSPVDSVRNPLIKENRPSVQVLTSGDETATKLAAENELASELKGITLSIQTNKILNLLPGDIVEVKNDEIFLFQYQRFMVNSVVVKETTKGDEMNISLMLPEAFTGEQPKNIFE